MSAKGVKSSDKEDVLKFDVLELDVVELGEEDVEELETEVEEVEGDGGLALFLCKYL